MSTYHLYPVFQARIVEETLHAWKLVEEATGRVRWLCKRDADRNNRIDQIITVRDGDEVSVRSREQQRAKHFVEQTYTYLTTDWGTRRAFMVELQEFMGCGWLCKDEATGLRVFIPKTCMHIAREVPQETLEGMKLMVQLTAPVEYCLHHEKVTATPACPEMHAPDAIVDIELLSVTPGRICFRDSDGYLHKAHVKILRCSREFQTFLKPGQVFRIQRERGGFPSLGNLLNEELRQWLTQHLAIGTTYEGAVESHYLNGVFFRLVELPYTAYIYLGELAANLGKGHRFMCTFHGWDDQGRSKFELMV